MCHTHIYESLLMKEDHHQMGVPHLFRCPISLDLFTDPVTLCTGQTYDRSSIEKWLSAGNLTCPVTMQKLHDLSIVPNHTLKHLINLWLSKDNRFNPDQLKMIDPDLSLATLKHNLIESSSSSSSDGDDEFSSFTRRSRVEETLVKILALSQLEWKRSCLIQLGFVQAILQFLFGNLCWVNSILSKEDLEIAERALDCVVNLLPYSELGPLNLLKESTHFDSFLVLLDRGSTKIKLSLCCLIEAIASSMETRELCLSFGQTKRLLKGVTALLRVKSEASEAGCKAISALCLLDSNRENVIQEGGIDDLITFLSNYSNHQAWRALATLELLLEHQSAKQALINNQNGVTVLVKMVFKVSDQGGSESAVSSLLKICYDSSRAREEAICAGVLEQLLLLLQSQCSGRAKSKARALLKLLRSMWANDPTKHSSQ